MSHIRYLLIALAVTAVAADRMEYEATTVANETLCPVRVEENDDPTRTPRVINYLRCDDQVNPMCADEQSSLTCCNSHHGKYNLNCVELFVFMSVKYEDRGEQTAKVPVGCSCMLTASTEAHEVPFRRKLSSDPQ